ncbi:hypothetical protein ACJ3XI_03535 [Litorimonas sp. RW-G-Af-16]|uniref:hypothetical protein n=1 Tax=Litorimonas sp. RW-G-Af-16 TaxID=3241168 RepID=UPI00390C4789
MQKLILTTILTAGMAFATPAMARGFDSTVTIAVTTPVKIEVNLSESMAHRANNLPKDISLRNGARSSDSGFTGNGFYGERDLAALTDYVQEQLRDDFDKRGVVVSDAAPVVLRVTIEDARPNRPTFKQLSREPGLSYRSFGLGGAELSAELISAGGESLGTMSYDYFENDIRDAAFGGTWSDARRSISRFARKASKTLSAKSTS